MTTPPGELVDALADLAKRHAAAAELRRHGLEAVVALRAALGGPLTPDHRRAALSVLGELKAPDAADALREALDSADEVVRSLGARGLWLLGTDDALAALVATLDDAPDLLHADVTPSATALSAMGLAALPPLLPVLAAGDPPTRQRAQRVLERVTLDAVGGDLPPPRAPELARHEWTALWKANGSYKWDGPDDARAQAVERWRAWLAARSQGRSERR